jgi:hypothetical protein
MSTHIRREPRLKPIQKALGVIMASYLPKRWSHVRAVMVKDSPLFDKPEERHLSGREWSYPTVGVFNLWGAIRAHSEVRRWETCVSFQ